MRPTTQVVAADAFLCPEEKLPHIARLLELPKEQWLEKHRRRVEPAVHPASTPRPICPPRPFEGAGRSYTTRSAA